MSFEIREVHALVRRPRRDEAQLLLERIALHVLPILAQRRFRVLRLQEFFPTNAHLLGMNVNRGVKIYLRLRPAAQPESFFPFEALLETMLHELTHMYLDELKTEMEALMIRGLLGAEGEKFHSAGEGRVIEASRSIPVRFQNDNAAAVLAAKRREQYQKLLGNQTSWRLGSGSNVDLTTIPVAPPIVTQDELRRKMLEAAERRRQDNERCTTTEAITQSIEVLGIDDSDEEEEGKEGRELGSADIVDLVGCSPPDLPCVALEDDTVQLSDEVVVIDLIVEEAKMSEEVDNDDDGEVAIVVSSPRRLPRKRKLEEAATDTIDLTEDD